MHAYYLLAYRSIFDPFLNKKLHHFAIGAVNDGRGVAEYSPTVGWEPLSYANGGNSPFHAPWKNEYRNRCLNNVAF